MKNFFTLCMSAALLTAASAGAVAALGSPDMQTAQAPARVAAQADGAKMYAFLPSSGVKMEARGLYSFSMNGDTPSFSFTGNKAEGNFTPVSMWQDGDQMRGFYYSDNNAYWFPTKIHTFTMTADGKLTEDADLIDVNGQAFLTGAYCPEDGYVYGIGWVAGSSTRSFVRAKADDLGNTETISTLNVAVSVSAMASCYNQKDGKFYFITNLNGTNGLYSIDKEGNRTFICNLGSDSYYYHQSTNTGMCYNAEEDAFYYVFYPYNGQPIYGNRGILKYSGAGYKTLTNMGAYPDGCYYSNLVYCEPTVSDNSPKAVSKVTWTSTGTAITVSCTLPSECTDGSAIGSFESVDIYAAGTDDKLGSATSGLTAGGDAVITIDTESLQAGAASWEIAAVANGKTGRRTSVSVWVGNDTPKAPSGLAYSQGRLTWTASETGVHGGYVAAPVTYNVYLDGVSVGSTQQTEYDLDMDKKQLDVYSATVEAEAGQLKSEKSNAVEFIAGEPISLPYSLALDSESQTRLLTTFGVSNSGREWGWGDSSWESGSVYYGSVDQYFALPDIRFDNRANRYRISFEVYMSVYSGTGLSQAGNEIGIYAGTEPTQAAMSEVVAPERVTGIGRWVKVEKDFVLPGQGTYYIALRNLWKENKYNADDCATVRIRNISIGTVELDNVPGIITGLTATAGEAGALKATIEFTMPTDYTFGTDIPDDTDIDAIVTNGQITKTVTGKPGEKMSFEMDATDGSNTFSVQTRIGEVVNNETVTATVFCGSAAPLAPENFKETISSDRKSVLLSWDAAEGVDGGYINPETTVYDIMIYDSNYSGLKKFDEVTGKTEYNYVVKNNLQARYQFGVKARNSVGTSGETAGRNIVLGEALALPVTQNFTEVTSGSFGRLSLVQQYWGDVLDATYGVRFSINRLNSFTAAPWIDNTADLSRYAYTADVTGPSKGRLQMPYFSTEGAAGLTLKATLWNGAQSGTCILMAMCPGMDAPEVISYVLGDNWNELEITLNEKYLNQPWVQIYFDADFTTASLARHDYFALTDLSIYDHITGVSYVDLASGICGGNGQITVSGHEGEEVTVVTLDGRTVAVRTAGETETIGVAAGVYVVRAGRSTAKVVVR